MAKRAKKDHDFAVNAFRVVEQAIGEHMDGTPLDAPESNPKASKRGHVRAGKLSREVRSAIARKAANKRWNASKETH